MNRKIFAKKFLISFVLCVVFLTASALNAQAMSFNAAVNYAVGTNPISVAVGDFNADGNPDLAVVNGNSNSVSILTGAGDGTFSAAVNYAVGSGPWSVAVGDFNRDGKPDLAVANEYSDSVSILTGAGDGTFNAAGNYAVGTIPTSVAVGDFNRDGNPDLAVANHGSDNVSILTGAGDGTFNAAGNYAVGSNPYSVAVGDFNRDGNPDLAVANHVSDNVSILTGVGDGTFNAAVNYAVGSYPTIVAVGDFNADGNPDLAVANVNSKNVSILMGAGDGTFNAAVNYAVGPGPYSVAVGDFNADGNRDLAVANQNSNSVSILTGAGDGTFNAAVNYAVGSWPTSVAVGDFNRDGNPDLAVTNYYGDSVSVLLNTSAPNAQALSFNSAVNYAVGTIPTSVAVGDFNRDGKPDLAVANPDSSNNVSILTGAGDGTFNAAVNYAAGTSPCSVAVGDFNRDGNPDLAVANINSNNVSILTGAGDGTFNAAVNYAAGSFPIFVAVGDFNRDGNPDLAVANWFSESVSILTGAGDGTFSAAGNYAVGSRSSSVAVGDFNGDGIPDLAVANYYGNSVSILMGVGDGTFHAAVNYAAGSGTSSVAVGDFNRDGKPDLAVTNYSSNNVSILTGAGDGTFHAAVNYAVGDWPSSVAVGDFNGDGIPDLAVANYYGNSVSILTGAEDGTFSAAGNYAVGTAPTSVAVGDFNRDGKPDLAVTNYGSDSVSVLLNTSQPLSTPSVTTQPANQTVIVGGNANFTAAASGNPAPTVQWQVSSDGGSTWGNITGATSTTLTLTGVALDQSGYEYHAVFTNIAGTATSDAATLTVNGIPPAVTTQPADQTVTVGGTTTFTAAASGTPDPTVQWQVSSDGGSTWGNITGATSTTLTLTGVALGQSGYEYRAVFTNIAGTATSDAATLTVNGIPPSVTTQPTDQTVTVGGTATFTAAASGTPDPTVQWQVSSDGGSTWGNITGATSTTLTLTGVALDQSGYEYRAVFTNIAGTATSDAAILTVTMDTTTNLVSNPNHSVYGQLVVLKASVTAASGTPSGNVTFKDGQTILGKVVLNGLGQANYVTNSLSVGTHSLIAVYSGDSGYNGSTSSATIQKVTKANTTVSVRASANPSVFGQSVTFTATVGPAAPGAVTPTGTVTFRDGFTIIGSVRLSGNTATFTTSTLWAGLHIITAYYGGDTNFEGSLGGLVQKVSKANTSTVVTSSVNPSVFGQSVTFTATVKATAPGSGTPTGTVTFKDGGKVLGTKALYGSGQATYTTTSLSVGTHSITAVYGGDSNFNGRTSPTLTQVVNRR